MECTVPVEVHLATEHADVGSLERTVTAALAEVGVRLWRELVEHLEAALPAPAACAPSCAAAASRPAPAAIPPTPATDRSTS